MESEITIVVADDKPEVVEAISKDISMLAKKHGKNIRVFQALSGSEVIQIAERENVDAFYIDYMFEYGINGDEIIESIDDPFETKFFILMSGWKEDVLQNVITKNHQRLKSRCRFLRKPVDMLTLQAHFLDMFSFFEARLYPLPINYVYESVRNSEGVARALALKDFYETLLKFSVSVLMTDLLNQSDGSNFCTKVKLDQGVTFGTWLWWLQDLLEFYKTRKKYSFVPEFIDFYKANPLNPLKVMGEFKVLRNNDLGHGYVKEEEWYKIAINDYEKSFEMLYKDLAFLSRYTLVFPEKAEILANPSDGFKYQVKSLMGSEMIPDKVNLTSALRLTNDKVYLYSPANKVLPLSPFVSYSICTRCNARKFYFLDRIHQFHLTYSSFCNHRIEDKEAKTHFAQSYHKFFL